MYVWQCLVSLELLVIVKEKQLCQKFIYLQNTAKSNRSLLRAIEKNLCGYN